MQNEVITWVTASSCKPNPGDTDDCGSNACVEVAKVDERYLVRDSKDRNGSVLSFTETEWTAFLEGAANGEFKL